MELGTVRRIQCDGCEAVAEFPPETSRTGWGHLRWETVLLARSARHHWAVHLDLCPDCVARLVSEQRLTVADSDQWSCAQKHESGRFVLRAVRQLLDECLGCGFPLVDQDRPDKEA